MVSDSSTVVALELFPCEQKFRNFRSEVEWNNRIPGKVLGLQFEFILLDGISGKSRNTCLNKLKKHNGGRYTISAAMFSLGAFVLRF